MNYYFDCEFREGFHKPLFGKARHFIELISIGIVSEDGREYSAIAKDFDLKAAWNSYQEELPIVMGDEPKKVYWLRDNVLESIYDELLIKERYCREHHWNLVEPFCKRTLKNLIAWNGKSNKQIAEDIVKFVGDDRQPKFYAYFADYDWVLLCSLFGKMMDLPKHFPYYCIDLKQILDEKVDRLTYADFPKLFTEPTDLSLEDKLVIVRAKHKEFPLQINEHNAIYDARWNKMLHKYLNTLK